MNNDKVVWKLKQCKDFDSFILLFAKLLIPKLDFIIICFRKKQLQTSLFAFFFTVENKKDSKFKSAIHLDDYLPRKAQTLQDTEHLLSRLEYKHKKLPSISDSHDNAYP